MTDQPIKIFLAMEEGPLTKAIKKVFLGILNMDSHIFADSASESDLVIFDEIRNIESIFDESRSYAYLDKGYSPRINLPDKCVVIDAFKIIPGFIEAVTNVKANMKPREEVEVPEKETCIRPDALSILVVDDNNLNIKSALEGLAGERLTTATGYQEALRIMGEKKFDVVLTDLHLPMSSQTLSDEAFKLGELVPYGILLMIEAARNGAKFVAVVTDLNHHSDPFSAAFDHYSQFSYKIEGAKVKMLHAGINVDGSKDWNNALKRVQS